jgi:hypothetical protein
MLKRSFAWQCHRRGVEPSGGACGPRHRVEVDVHRRAGGDSATLPTHQPALTTAQYAFTKSPTQHDSVVHSLTARDVVRDCLAPGQEQNTV